MAIVTSPQYTSLPPQTDSPCNLDGLESVLTGVDPFGNTLLHSAAAKEDGHLAEIPKLLQLGANVEAMNKVCGLYMFFGFVAHQFISPDMCLQHNGVFWFDQKPMPRKVSCIFGN